MTLSPLRALLLLLLYFGGTHAWATGALPLLSQYEHRSWVGREATPGTPNSVVQTTDGYLWIATDQGLVRFDGARFVAKNVFAGRSVASWRVISLLASRDGSLWLGAVGHVARISEGKLQEFPVVGRVNRIVQEENGTVWFTQSRTRGEQGALCSISSGLLRCFGAPELPYAAFDPLLLEQDGSLWMGSDQGLCHRMPSGRADCFLHQMLGPDYGLMGITAIARNKRGEKWLGIPRGNHPFGLGQLVDGEWRPFKAKTFDGSSLDVSSLIVDAEDTIWVGTFDRGIYRIRGESVDHFGRGDGLTDNRVIGLFADAEGTVWVYTAAGIDTLRRLPVSVYSTNEGLPSNDVSAVLAASDGTVWISGRPAGALRDGVRKRFSAEQLLQGKRSTALLEDHRQRIWLGVDGELVVMDAGRVSYVKDASGLSPGVLLSLVEDSNHDVWAIASSPRSRLLRIHDLTFEMVPTREAPTAIAADPLDGVWVGFKDSYGRLRQGVSEPVTAIPGAGPVRGITFDADGTMLLSATAGLVVASPAQRWLLDSNAGLPCADAVAAVRDAARALWIRLGCGVVRIESTEFDRWRLLPQSPIQLRHFDDTDGFRAGRVGFFPAVSVAPDGVLWFDSATRAQSIDPSNLPPKLPPPRLHVDAVVADRVEHPAVGAIKLSGRTRDIEVRYNALSFVAAGKIRFRYMLEGRDKDWVDADTRREAFYTDLPPGNYRFRVSASRGDGLWNTQDTSVSFELEPAFYQRWWFMALCAVLGLSLIYVAYVMRLRQIDARYRDRLRVRNSERERIARDLHDTLLQSTEGLVLIFQATADRLPADDAARAAIDRALERASSLIAEGRDRVHDLRNVEAPGRELSEVLTAIGDRLAAEHGIDFSVAIEGPARPIESHFFDQVTLIAREAIQNAFQHADARSIKLHLRYSDAGLRLVVEDDGKGIDPSILVALGKTGRWGLRGMHERAQKIGATLEVCRCGDGGTRVEMWVPQSAYGGRATAADRFRRWFGLRAPGGGMA